MRIRLMCVAAAAWAAAWSGAGAAAAEVPHPFLLWTREEAAALRKRIETDPQAARQYQRMKTTEIGQVNPTLMNLFDYLVMGDRQAGEREKRALLDFLGTRPEGLTLQGKDLVWHRGGPSSGDRHMRDERTLFTLRYDVLYDELSPQERRGVEEAFRAYIDFHVSGHKPWHPDFKYDRTSWLPNMHWPRAIGTHLMAVALRDERLIDAMFNSTGGFKWFFDEYVADGRFYMEEFGKYYSNIGTILMYCEALERLGLGRYGYGYAGKGGATVRKFIEMPVWIGLPRLEAPPGGMPRYPGVLMGDAGDAVLIQGYSAAGKGGNAWWSTAHMNGPLPKLQLPGWFEIAHRRWPDGGFDYFLAQLRAPGEDLYLPSLYWGLGPVDPKQVKPPPAPSYVSRERGFALLRAEEGPAYWESPRPAVALQFGMYYVHYVHDCFSILRYVAHNRVIYERMGRGTKTGYAGGDEWRDHVRGHSGVVVDGLKAQPVDNGNHGCANHRIREDLAGPVRFVAARAKGIYPDVDQERALFLTDEYLLDVFWLAGDRPRVYDWQVLAHGRLQDLGTPAWKPLAEVEGGKIGGRDLARPQIQHIHVFDPGDKDWAAAIVQDPEARGIGVRVSALGEAGTLVLGSKPPGVGEQGDGVSLLITRHAPAALFTVLHEPFEGGPGNHPVERFERIAPSDKAVAVRVIGKAGTAINDRVLLAYGDGADEPLTLAGGGESFTFAGHAYLRVGPDKVEAVGDLRAMRLKVEGSPRLLVGGKEAQATVSGGYLVFERQP